MRRVPFIIAKSYTGGISDCAYLDDDEEPAAALVAQVPRTLGIEINVTVGDVTMFLSAWEDPAHWSDDWSKVLGVPCDEVPDAVEALLAAAVEG